MENREFDVIILGSGPAGYYAALNCSGRGNTCLVVEKENPGGTGLRWGALPVKGGLDLLRNPRPGDIASHFIKKMEKIVQVEALIKGRYESAGISYLEGDAEIISPRILKINSIQKGEELRVSCKYLVIATGTSPDTPRGFEIDGTQCVSHRELLFEKKLPSALAVLGGNVEGIELAFLYAGLGVPVTVWEQEDEILPGNDHDLVYPLKERMKELGVEFRMGIRVNAPSSMIKKEGEVVLVTGLRKANLPEGLKELGVDLYPQGIKVDENLETSIPGVYAIGDVNGILGMAHVAIHQGLHIHLGFQHRKALGDYTLLPRSIFTVPEISGAGLQENELPGAGSGYRVVKIPLAGTWRGYIREEEGFLKLIFDQEDKLVGIWGSGRDLSEFLSTSAFLLGRRFTPSDILDTLFIHPTMGEGILEAAIKIETKGDTE